MQNVTDMGTLFLQNKKLNLGPAVKKQAPTRIECSELVVVSGQNMRGILFPMPFSALPVNPYLAYHPVRPPYYTPPGCLKMQIE